MRAGTAAFVLLAAGRATRMRGTDKLMEAVDGRPLIRRQAERCMKAGPTRVVLGPDQQTRHAALDGLDVAVRNAPAGAGMAASLVVGVADLDAPAAAFVLADMPDITASDLHLLAHLHATGAAPILRAATADGRPGHPVLFDRRYFAQIAQLTGDTGAAPILKAHAGDVVLVPLEGTRAITDLDTPEDWADWRARQGTVPSTLAHLAKR